MVNGDKMKRTAAFLIFGLFFVTSLRAAEEAVPAQTSSDTSAATATMDAPAADMETTAPVTDEAMASAPEPVTTEEAGIAAAEPATNTDALEFVSGEVSSLDDPGKSLTIKLYGETENTPTDKTLKVTVVANTDITDGEEDRELKSLSVGTEVDVEYDPANNLATYIFVY